MNMHLIQLKKPQAQNPHKEDAMKKKKETIDDLMEKLKKPHTQKEYKDIHRAIKCILRKDFIRYISISLISLLISITALIVQLLK